MTPRGKQPPDWRVRRRARERELARRAGLQRLRRVAQEHDASARKLEDALRQIELFPDPAHADQQRAHVAELRAEVRRLARLIRKAKKAEETL